MNSIKPEYFTYFLIVIIVLLSFSILYNNFKKKENFKCNWDEYRKEQNKNIIGYIDSELENYRTLENKINELLNEIKNEINKNKIDVTYDNLDRDEHLKELNKFHYLYGEVLEQLS